jgi:hypothetical protein
MTDDKLQVNDLLFINDEFVALRYENKEEFVAPLSNTNVVIAAYVTAHARLKLYELLERLQDRILYFDTDSILYEHKEGVWNPPLGDYLGELKDETNGVPICTFLSGGPKNYAYETVDGKQVCKIRGFSLNSRNSLQLNFDSLKDLITTDPKEAVQEDEDKQTIVVTEPFKIVRENGHIFNRSQDKQYKLVYSKRIVCTDYFTYPFGWKFDKTDPHKPLVDSLHM